MFAGECRAITRIHVPAIEPIVIIYEGLDADYQSLDLACLAKSLDGLSRIIAITANFGVTGEYVQHYDSLSVKVRATAIAPGSFTLKAIIDYVTQSQFLEEGRTAFLAALFRWIFEKLGKRKNNEIDPTTKAVLEAMQELGIKNQEIALKQLEVMEKMADNLGAAARNAVAPIGESCTTLSIEVSGNGRATWDAEDKKAILERTPAVVQPENIYKIVISELDRNTGAAKVSFGPEDSKRYKAKISDPEVHNPNNNYAQALSSQDVLVVKAKAEIVAGEIVQLFISNSGADFD